MNINVLRAYYYDVKVIEVPEGMELDRDSIKFKKIEKQLPNSWEEYCNRYEAPDMSRFSDWFYNIWRNLPEDLKAIQQLRLLRDCYNDGSNCGVYCLGYNGRDSIDPYKSISKCFLNFKTADLRDKFLENFKDIIEIAKPLL